MGATIQLTELSKILFNTASKQVKRYNPCDFINGKCKKNRFEDTRDGCCGGCEFLAEDGCSTKALSCKLFLCEVAMEEQPYLRGYMDALYQIYKEVDLRGIEPNGNSG